MIINFRGTHGSGKTWVMGQVIRRLTTAGLTPTPIIARVPELGTRETEVARVYLRPDPLFILGKYDPETACGGVDRMKSTHAIRRLIQSCYNVGDVMLEGIMVSGGWAAYESLVHEGYDFRWVFINTPIDRCIEQVNRRRAERGQPELQKLDNLLDHQRRCERYINYCRQRGYRYWVLTAEDAVDLAWGWIQSKPVTKPVVQTV